ncbi:ribosome biogenesis GTPase YlqF [Lactobacillus sp. S2-2]|uniref:ribosome biogenesis GTPase YlqF n=1 Tax=Lactobacillus sp. S2-2 TaxID=2692917 RepID=UPI001F0312FD|nr:ribosome biogenesis GTPase YlqF [Lactobacillus sp. S2-2]MCF6515030.1 ribosome biogenesis GTPase YlqF [Lactobacillus sp. S2-2]
MASNIQWFPGHMAKAIRQFEENVHLVDIIFELVDSRAPFSSINPEVSKIGVNKPKLLIMTKADLADADKLKKWVNYFNNHGIPAMAIDSKNPKTRKIITKKAQEILADKRQLQSEKGLDKKAIKAICVGVPNVGKSTLLNQLVQKKSAAVGNRPGVTKGQQWLTSSSELELLDTPGILWPKFQNQDIAYKLAVTGAIKDSLLHMDDVALFALKYFRENNQEQLKQRYHLIDDDLLLSDVELLLKITSKLGMKDDYDRASERIIIDIRRNKLGGFVLDKVDDLDEG